MLFDHKQTQATHGLNYTDDFYERQDKEVREDYREKKWPSDDQFWKSSELKTFRVFYPKYSQHIRFKKWLKAHTNNFNEETDKTMHQILDEKYGKMDDYSDYDKVRENPNIPAVYHYNNRFFMEKDEKEMVKHDPQGIPFEITIKNGGEEFDYDAMIREEAKKIAGMKKE